MRRPTDRLGRLGDPPGAAVGVPEVGEGGAALGGDQATEAIGLVVAIG